MATSATRFFVKGDTIHFVGPLVESTRFHILKAWNTKLKLNLAEVTEISSMGIRRMLDFLESWGERPLEYHDCPVEFLAFASEIGALRGLSQQAEFFMAGEKIRNINAYLQGHAIPTRPPQSLAFNGKEERKDFPAAGATDARKEEFPHTLPPSQGHPQPDEVIAVSDAQIEQRIRNLADATGCYNPDGSIDMMKLLDQLTNPVQSTESEARPSENTQQIRRDRQMAA